MTELSAKEKIKLKKKLKEKQALEPEAMPVVEAPIDTQPAEKKQELPDEALSESQHQVEILNIFPEPKPKAKFFAKGNLKLKIHSIGLEVRNVPYSISKGKQVKLQKPFRYHRFPDEPGKPDEYVSTISFKDNSIWKEVTKVAEKAVLKHHCKDELETKLNDC